MRSLTPYNVLASTNYHNQILIVMGMARNGVDIRHPLPLSNVHTSLSWYTTISLNCFNPCCVIYTSFFQWGHHSKDYLFKPRLTLWEFHVELFPFSSIKMIFTCCSCFASVFEYMRISSTRTIMCLSRNSSNTWFIEFLNVIETWVIQKTWK